LRTSKPRIGWNWIAVVALVAWTALLVRLIVFKKIPILHIGHRIFRFGGSYRTGPPNLVPFHTILPQLRSDGNWLMSKVNLLGNVLPFIPIGIVAPLVYRRMTWPKAFLLAGGTGLLMEMLEVVFRVGIFDVDDILLNGFGVLIGYAIIAFSRQRARR
jgi:glycopeptide antibiotics resistance protein